MRIPITMCHGIDLTYERPLTVERFNSLMAIAAEFGFESMNYDQLAAWRQGLGAIPARPIMIDFDHPVRSMRYEIKEVLDRYSFKGNLFVNTGVLDPTCQTVRHAWQVGEKYMQWEEIRDLLDAGWHIGAHTHTHPNLSELFTKDRSGEKLRAELDRNESLISQHLGIIPKDFAFTGTSWSSLAETEVKKRYRFGRLWIVGSIYKVDGKEMRYAELVGAAGPDEADGGPPFACRYITKQSDPYRLPSMDLQALIFKDQAFRRYLEGALEAG